jgi:hypothetical protein
MINGYAEAVGAALQPLAAPPRALRIRFGGADNADHYALALAFGAWAIASNCAVHLLLNNLVKRHTNLWNQLGEDGVRAAVLAFIKLLRDVPCLVSAGPVSSTVEARDDVIFTVGCQLLIKELREAGLEGAAHALESEYMSSPRKLRWGGCYFPRFIPNHNSGAESMNGKIAKELSKFHLCETVEFTARCMAHLRSKAEIRGLPENGFKTTMERITKDNRTWRKVHKLINEVSARRTVFVNDKVARLQMHSARSRFMRATSERWSIPSASLLEHLLLGNDGREQPVLASLGRMRELHCRLVSDPEGYEATMQPSLNQYLRIAVRAFYVLQALEPGEVRSRYCQFSCTCGFHRIRSYCKHAIALTIMLRLVEVPSDLDYRILTRLQSRGRKRLRRHVELLRNFRQDAAISNKETGDERDSGSETNPDSGNEFERDTEDEGDA